MSIEWKEAYKIGQAEIDKQHQQLFGLVNAMMAADNLPSVRKLIMELYKHTREHFELEERLMRQHKFPDIDLHTSHHNQLLGRLNEVSQEVGKGQLNKAGIEELMYDWALKHIPQEDARLATFMAQQE